MYKCMNDSKPLLVPVTPYDVVTGLITVNAAEAAMLPKLTRKAKMIRYRPFVNLQTNRIDICVFMSLKGYQRGI